MEDLADRDDVMALVSAFYRRAFADPLIGPVFTEVAAMDLDHHLPIIGDFWETVLLGAGRYRRDAMRMHLALHGRSPLGAAEFDRWLVLWTASIDERFAGPVADRAKEQAARIAGSMQRRLAGASGSAFETISLRDAALEGGAR